MHDDSQGTCVISHVAKGLVDLAGGAISRLNVHPAHRIGGVAEALDDENLGLTFHPGAALRAGRPNGKAGVSKAGIVSYEIGHSTSASVAEGHVTFGSGGLEGHRAELVPVGRIDHVAGQGFGFGQTALSMGFADIDERITPSVLGSFHLAHTDGF